MPFRQIFFQLGLRGPDWGRRRAFTSRVSTFSHGQDPTRTWAPISLRCTESTAFQDLLCFPSDPRPGTVWCARWPRAIPRRPTRSVPDFGNATSPGGAAISRPGGRAHHVGLIEPADRLAVRVPSAVAVSATPISRAHITRRARSSLASSAMPGREVGSSARTARFDRMGFAMRMARRRLRSGRKSPPSL